MADSRTREFFGVPKGQTAAQREAIVQQGNVPAEKVRSGRRHTASVLVLSLALAANSGCLLTVGLWDWADSDLNGITKIDVHARSRTDDERILFFVDEDSKHGTTEAYHLVSVRANWEQLEVTKEEPRPGVWSVTNSQVEVPESHEWTLRCNFRKHGESRRIPVDRVSERAARRIDPRDPTEEGRSRYCAVFRRAGRGTLITDFFGYHTSARRWVLLGSTSPWRPLRRNRDGLRKTGAVIATPFAVIGDIILFPVYLIWLNTCELPI